MSISSAAAALIERMMQWTMISFVSLADPALRNIQQLSGASAAAPLVAHLRQLMPGELFPHASSEIARALDRANSSSSNSSAWSAKDAGLQVDPRATAAHCTRHAVPISTCVAVVVSAAIEYTAAEVLELAGNAATQRRRGRKGWRKREGIEVRDVKMAVRGDVELRGMFRPFWGCQAAGGAHARVRAGGQHVGRCESESSAGAAAGAVGSGGGEDDDDDAWVSVDGDDVDDGDDDGH